jgi:hydroxypyruvate isomerase
MERRSFIKRTVAASAAAGMGAVAFGNHNQGAMSNAAKFNLKYAPSLRMFRNSAGEDPIEVIKFCNDQGFRAIFDNNFLRKEPALQDSMMNELNRLGMDFGPFVIRTPRGENSTSMVFGDPEITAVWIEAMKGAIEVSKRTGAKQGLIVPGEADTRLEMDYQTANVIDCLRELSEMAEAAGLVIVLEPLNRQNHPGRFLTGMPQAYAICRGVNSPSCKIVDDMYHQQITEGNIIPNIDKSWSEIGAFHIGDNPGRDEPGTGEINYLNIFKHIFDKGFDGVLGMEHGNSIDGIEGEKAVIEAYRKVDNFPT